MRSRRLLAALGIFVSAGVARAADPSNDEQYFLEITNRMRLNPQAELKILANIIPGSPATWGTPKSSEPNVDNALQYFGTNANTLLTQWNALVPVPALAWNTKLNDSALYHANQVIAHGHDADPQQHQFVGEPTLGQRFINAGYTGFTAGAENLYAYTYNAFHGHAGFAIDWRPNADG